VDDNDAMSEHEEGSATDPEGATSPASPFARPPGYEGNVGYGPPPAPPEPRFAGVPYGSAHAPTSEFPAYSAPYGSPTEPWQQPPGDAWTLPPQGYDGGYGDSPPPRGRKPWVLVAVLVVALIAGGTTIGLVGTDSKSNTPTADPNLPTPLSSPSPNQTPAPNTSPAPNASAVPTNPTNPANPLPNVGLPTPPALLAIGYHVYSSRLREPGEVAIDAAEEVQFKKDGLERIVGLRALTIGTPGNTSDDYDADVSILRFKDAAGAKAELDYSNKRNKADSGANTIALPGLPQVTAFLNKESSGYSIGAFASVGRYQVVLILGGLSPNAPANSAVLASEAARVMKALLAAASSIEPDESAGSQDPLSPFESPSQAPSDTPPQTPSGPPFEAPSAGPSGIHA
jgi:hypothetical protein